MRGRRGVATTAFALAAVASAPAGAQTQEATFTLAYESDLRSTTETIYTPTSSCYSSRGSESTAAQTTTRSIFRIKVWRVRLNRRHHFEFAPARGYDASTDRLFPLRLRQQRNDRYAVQRRDPAEEGEGCGPYLGEPRTETLDCRQDAHLVLREDAGRLLAAHRADERSNCRGEEDPDGYPGNTNLFRYTRRISLDGLYRNRKTVVKGKDSRKRERSERTGGYVANTVQTDQASWVVTLQRTSPWRTRRR